MSGYLLRSGCAARTILPAAVTSPNRPALQSRAERSRRDCRDHLRPQSPYSECRRPLLPRHGAQADAREPPGPWSDPWSDFGTAEDRGTIRAWRGQSRATSRRGNAASMPTQMSIRKHRLAGWSARKKGWQKNATPDFTSQHAPAGFTGMLVPRVMLARCWHAVG